MGKPNKTQARIIELREKRQGELEQIEVEIKQCEQEISQLVQARLQNIGALKQLDELEKG